MDDNQSKYELLILKELEEELSSHEKTELKSWLREPENQLLYEEQKKLWNLMDELHRMKKISMTKALKKVEGKLFGRLSFNFLKRLERVAAILFIPLLLASIWLFGIQRGAEFSGLQYNTVQVPLGMRSSITLPDGTLVSLNSGSSLKYPVAFTGKTRNVELAGEAFFDVTKNKNKPFIVSASDIDIKVLGTAFNCCAYPEDQNIETALVRGSIEITKEKDERHKLCVKPGEVATYSKTDRTIEKNKVNLDKFISWKSGKLIFRDDSMATVLEKLGRWYNVEFQVKDKEILSYEYSATFSEESLDQVLKILTLSSSIHYQLLPRQANENNSYDKQIIVLMKQH